ncbi:MAG: cytochrome c oxidase subunit 3 [Thermoanaerobaculum sp.]|nr:cytochrome c oxidase subunit 3 [Thermoanaerobaculum sp.]
MNQARLGSAGRLGMRLFLLSLSILFAASLVGILVVRAQAPSWPPPGAPSLPQGLWVSTALILLSSWTLWRAQKSWAHGGEVRVAGWLMATSLVALVFLANQTVSWLAMAPAVKATATALYAFSFFLLTVLHAVHVLGGLVSLGFVTAKAWGGSLTQQGLNYAAMYWHFLTVVWLVLFAALKLLL